MHRNFAYAAALAATLAGAPAHAKDIGTFPAAAPAAGAWQVTLSTVPIATPQGPADPGLIPGRVLTLVAKVAPAGGAKGPPAPLAGATFEARMPEHDHGMVTRAQVTETAPGEFRIDGVKLHMAGA